MPKPHELLNVVLLVLISSGISILCTLYMVDRHIASSGSRVLVVDTTEMARYIDDTDRYRQIAARMNEKLDAYAAQGYVVLDGAMVLRFPSTAAVNPEE